MTQMEKIFSELVFGETLPKPTLVKLLKVKLSSQPVSVYGRSTKPMAYQMQASQWAMSTKVHMSKNRTAAPYSEYRSSFRATRTNLSSRAVFSRLVKSSYLVGARSEDDEVEGDRGEQIDGEPAFDVVLGYPAGPRDHLVVLVDVGRAEVDDDVHDEEHVHQEVRHVQRVACVATAPLAQRPVFIQEEELEYFFHRDVDDEPSADWQGGGLACSMLWQNIRPTQNTDRCHVVGRGTGRKIHDGYR
ncbi:hypothetical protein EYF80_043050 [Liparis tanakae]|uniref:Uncharacterized protein n=1 Tax=Liparis tanakae TaxID=230148 RepID=A0A4Z2G0X0_9TELE|nr:hypothetical protein EYF80_043050 [Liparis tanakae]